MAMTKQQTIQLHQTQTKKVEVEKEKETISKGLERRIEEANQAADTAEKKIIIAYNYAIKTDKLEPIDAAKVLYKRLKYSPQWIRKFLPVEAKMMTKSRKHQPKRKFVKELSSIVIPVDRVRKFYGQLHVIEVDALKHGLKIDSFGVPKVLVP